MSETAKQAGIDDLQDAWRWFIGLGGSLVLFGVLASVGLAFQTVASANLVGLLMVCGGTALVAHGLNMRRLGWFYFWLASGLLYAIAGIAVLYDPGFAITTITLFLAADFIVIAFLRLWIAMGARDTADGAWLLVTCTVTIGLSALFTMRPAVSALWILICALALDLLMQGAAFAAMGISRSRQLRAARRAARDAHQ
jgi:uncharacterized membrane protein HdeD (DUF308 family)